MTDQEMEESFESWPIRSASMRDLDTRLFTYLSASLPADVLEENDRSLEQQLMAMRFTAPDPPHPPTVLGLLVLGKDPAFAIPGAYIQFSRVDGPYLTDPIKLQSELHGPLPDILQSLDALLKVNSSISADITSGPIEVRHSDYPLVALQQLTRNAIMHRNQETSNAPVRITWLSDRVEIQNPGGPYGQVTKENFGSPGITDYRNPHLAAAMKDLGYVQRFGVGIALAKKALADNGSPDLELEVQENHVSVVLRRRP